MPRLQSLAPLLRPLAAPRVVASRPHFRFSTARPWHAEQSPPNASSKQPLSPQAAQRAADLAAAESLTEADSAQPPEDKPVLPSKHPRADNKPTSPKKANGVAPPPPWAAPKGTANTTKALKQKAPKKPKTPRAPETSLPPPKYTVSRSTNKNLPIYTDYKRGGNLHQTLVRKITGDVMALRDELRVFLNKKDEDVIINSLTRHIVVKGHHANEITQFLVARGF
ncbi:hypothetical protein ACJQWK_02880 [Exserohilum turcicum]|uniref:Large ribosomal subunit protein mL49 n=1 Tax=Exserohilum turcicum (strain 28A) TaxID=671987 RepID=R0KL83_EXST2|nr:uncharacterized protein SETTUDRAFT_167638 [Exserohilum turcica Et28A]EOA89919.1 hypothetical protein SETTUDRAFT_167638 [Exserohilum turcica Et28A]